MKAYPGIGNMLTRPIWLMLTMLVMVAGLFAMMFKG